MPERIRVGFIGLNPDSHWAATAHIPALKTLSSEFEIIGVANSTKASAEKTADTFGLKYAFASPQELVACKEVDLVVVTVKVPHHFELVSAALEAGKHVHCEWPLGNGLEEARKLTQIALEKGVVATIGTQMTTAVEIDYLHKLIKEGYVGEVLSTSLIGSGGNWGASTVAELAYLSDKSTGATMVTIPFGHTLAGIQTVLGPLSCLSGRLLKRRNTIYLSDTEKHIAVSADDQIMANGVFASGAAFSAHYRGGVSRGTNLLWEINGTEGDIQVTASLGHAQMVQLSLFGARNDEQKLRPLTIPEELYANRPDNVMARNVAGIYKLIAEDIHTNSRIAPSFNDGLRLHELLDSLEQSSRQLDQKIVL